ncbi:hypothetical protein Xen7305DRAFT_00029970 [Xenococcus sp. PCC 7305]|uniref:hypothetical protein n=1 Tax=Xenococcus sp. PCC 7305 TaxID=102125 RepID=UPI0002AC7599|nr:hypothetical protein [Xenococcus sp. PCC 7305]ELS03276.1 hypothetical protein Xen7305DRAFT_00029970 [Xenococcus sp. PCC 7305]
MSNNNKIFANTSGNQNLFIELNDAKAETVSGGYEVFTIRNNTNYNVGYTVDGTSWTHQPGEEWVWTAYSGGTIEFDLDGRSDTESYQTYNLANGGIYEFQDNNTTLGNPYDIELYDIG